MSTPRRRAREFALQGLYQWQYTGDGPAQVLKNLSELDEFAEADQEFLGEQLRGTIAEAAGLRAQIEPLADRKWDDLSPIERGILMLAAWELVHKQDIPYRVTINEAIELGKTFGGTDGHKYVNGVLDRLAAAVRAEEVAAPRLAKPRRKKGKA
jgi:transcription antitermination protein NusB